MKRLTILMLFCSCNKEIIPDIRGMWNNETATYNFFDELEIIQDGVVETYCYYVSNDSVYLDYGLPFKIELLTETDLILSKRSDSFYMTYEFKRSE